MTAEYLKYSGSAWFSHGTFWIRLSLSRPSPTEIEITLGARADRDADSRCRSALTRRTERPQQRQRPRSQARRLSGLDPGHESIEKSFYISILVVYTLSEVQISLRRLQPVGSRALILDTMRACRLASGRGHRGRRRRHGAFKGAVRARARRLGTCW